MNAVTKDTTNLWDTLESMKEVSEIALNKTSLFYDKVKDYDSLIELLIDLLRSFGITEEYIISQIVKLIVNPKTSKLIDDARQKSLSNVYELLNEDSDEEGANGWLLKVGDGVKDVISAILTSLLSCSINPYLPARVLDNYEGVSDKGVKIPLSALDFCGSLQTSPLGTTGAYFYGLDSSIITKKEDAYGNITYITNPSILYRTSDMNAFIWNSLNRNNTTSYVEKNKMTWDSRKTDKAKFGIDSRNKEDGTGWANWLQSKAEGSYDFTASTETLYPILNFEKGEAAVNEVCLNVTLPSQRYDYLNKRGTIYGFNKDYLNSINLFYPKVLLMNILFELSNVNLFPEMSANISIKKQMMDAKIASVVTKLMTADDLSVSDCYYTFSNEEYNALLKEADLRLYNAKGVNTTNKQAVVYDPNTVSEAAKMLSGDSTTITRAIYEVVDDASVREQIKTAFGFNYSVTSNFLSDVIYAIIMPLVRAVFSPQILLLFLINFDIMGMIDLTNIDATQLAKLETIIFRKLTGALKSIVKYINEEIIQVLYNMFEEKLKELMEDMTLSLLIEEMDAWIKLLKEAQRLYAKFENLKSTGLSGSGGADIIEEQNIPEIEGGC